MYVTCTCICIHIYHIYIYTYHIICTMQDAAVLNTTAQGVHGRFSGVWVTAPIMFTALCLNHPVLGIRNLHSTPIWKIYTILNSVSLWCQQFKISYRFKISALEAWRDEGKYSNLKGFVEVNGERLSFQQSHAGLHILRRVRIGCPESCNQSTFEPYWLEGTWRLMIHASGWLSLDLGSIGFPLCFQG